MGKKIHFKTLSLGSNPDNPSVDELSSEIKEIKGDEIDLISLQMIRSCRFQKEAKIDEPGVGGEYASPRLNEALTWDDDSGPITDFSELIKDYSDLIKREKNIRSVHVSPSMLDTAPKVSDEDSFSEFCVSYGIFLRSLRDIRINGHVILAKNPDPLEIELTSKMRSTIIYIPEPENRDFQTLLEYTSRIVLPGESLNLLPSLLDNYRINQVFLERPNEDELKGILDIIDIDNIAVAGYATGKEEEYWSLLKDSAEINVL